MDTARKQELHTMLVERRREVAGEIKEKIHDVRAEGAEQHNSRVVRNPTDVASDDVQEDIELALIQMKSDTLTRIDQALGRLTQGLYGYCLECSEEISEQRLRALPFALRCKDCQEAQETVEQRERSRSRSLGLFADFSSQSDSSS